MALTRQHLADLSCCESRVHTTLVRLRLLGEVLSRSCSLSKDYYILVDRRQVSVEQLQGDGRPIGGTSTLLGLPSWHCLLHIARLSMFRESEQQVAWCSSDLDTLVDSLPCCSPRVDLAPSTRHISQTRLAALDQLARTTFIFGQAISQYNKSSTVRLQ